MWHHQGSSKAPDTGQRCATTLHHRFVCCIGRWKLSFSVPVRTSSTNSRVAQDDYSNANVYGVLQCFYLMADVFRNVMHSRLHVNKIMGAAAGKNWWTRCHPWRYERTLIVNCSTSAPKVIVTQSTGDWSAFVKGFQQATSKVAPKLQKRR